MSYWQLFYHIVWGTKNREPFLTTEVECILHDYIKVKAIGLGATVFEVNGWFEHVHVVTTIPPKISVATFIGQIKAAATAKFNKSGHPHAPIYWQDEYSVFSLDRQMLSNYINYVQHQKEHHTEGSVIPILEMLEQQGGILA